MQSEALKGSVLSFWPHYLRCIFVITDVNDTYDLLGTLQAAAAPWGWILGLRRY